MIRGILENDVELVANVNPRNKKILTILPEVLGEITKHGCVQCFAGYNMIFPPIIGCPLLKQEARRKLEYMGMEILTQCEYGKKEKCGPNSEISRGLSCQTRSVISDRLG